MMYESSQLQRSGRATQSAAPAPPRHETAIVVEALPGAELVIQLGGAQTRARRAVSCLVEPIAGDQVLALTLPTGVVYVVAVLERRVDAPTTLVSDGDLELRPASGKLKLAGEGGVEVQSSTEVSMTAPKLRLQAREGSVVMGKLSFVGRALTAHLDRLQLTSVSVESVVDRLTQVMRLAYRTVSESEHARVGRLDYRADDSLSLQGKTAFVTGSQLAKVDGEQIHVG
jgi:hypothetical protein